MEKETKKEIDKILGVFDNMVEDKNNKKEVKIAKKCLDLILEKKDEYKECCDCIHLWSKMPSPCSSCYYKDGSPVNLEHK